jgi:AcrR family transcriptional regulator
MADVKSKRSTRVDRAAQTRLRMVRAAYELFTERGYQATTMGDIADLAGIAVQTLHFTFGTKAVLLQNTYDYAVIGEGERLPPDKQPWYAEFRASTRLQDALEILVDNVGAVLARTAPLDDFVRSAAHEPHAARIRSHSEMMRRQAWTAMVEQLGSRFTLTDDLNTRYAVDILMLLMSPTSYQTFVGEYGWTPAKWRSWCASAITAQLFGESKIRSKAGPPRATG